MASAAITRPKRPPAPFRSLGRSMLLTLPMALWALLLFTPTLQSPGLNRTSPPSWLSFS